jgi:zinc finger SWIM domain-containing protein 3
MAKAISLVMPETFHGLCTWHIRQNALRHVNHLYQRSSQFNLEFEACIDLHEEEDEILMHGILYLLSIMFWKVHGCI